MKCQSYWNDKFNVSTTTLYHLNNFDVLSLIIHVLPTYNEVRNHTQTALVHLRTIKHFIESLIINADRDDKKVWGKNILFFLTRMTLFYKKTVHLATQGTDIALS